MVIKLHKLKEHINFFSWMISEKRGYQKPLLISRSPQISQLNRRLFGFVFYILGSFCEIVAGESPAPDLVDGRGMGRDEDIFVLSLFS